MNIQTDIPQIAVLREAVEAQEGRMMRTHPDFVKLRQTIYGNSKEFISESTLERVWEYSTRGYETVSLRTLDVLARFVGCKDWDGFCEKPSKRTTPNSSTSPILSMRTACPKESG
jgi:hypothetical protein